MASTRVFWTASILSKTEETELRFSSDWESEHIDSMCVLSGILNPTVVCLAAVYVHCNCRYLFKIAIRPNSAIQRAD